MKFASFFNVLGLTQNVGVQTNLVTQHGSASSSTPVNIDSAMQVSAFWACVRLIVESISSMGLTCKQQTGEGWADHPNHDLWKLINYQPNRYQTRVEFFETLTLNLCTSGDAYIAIERTGRGKIISLIPLMTAQMTVELQKDGSKLYHYLTANGDLKVYAESSIWHLPLFGNGITGFSPLSFGAKSLGISLDSDDRAAKLASTGGKIGGVLMVDKVLSPEQRNAVRKNFSNLCEGNSDELFVLEASMKYQQTTLSPTDAQLLETRDFQIADIARFMGVPSVLINHNSGQTAWGSGIQQIITGFFKFNLRPYLNRIEVSIERHLMDPSERGKVQIRFDFDDLLAETLAVRLEARNKAINSGQLTPNEARAEEGRGPKEGGNKIYLNGTLVPAGTPPRQTTQGGQNGNEI